MKAANEERRRQAEIQKYQAECGQLRAKVAELELKLHQRAKPAKRSSLSPQEESSGVSISSIKHDIEGHLQQAQSKAELDKRIRNLLVLWHPDKHPQLENAQALATRVTQIIIGVKERLSSMFK